MRLIAERVDKDEALRSHLIAAYIVGFAHPMSRFGEAYTHIPPCDAPDQTGCIASWDTLREGANTDDKIFMVHWNGEGAVEPTPLTIPRQCTNPLTWRASDQAPSSAHKGAIHLRNEGVDPTLFEIFRADEPVGINVTGIESVHPNLIGA